MQITAAQPQDWGQIEGSSTGIPVLRPKAQNAQAGLGSLVLTVVELVRQLMEAQVVRRMEAGRLTEAEIERAGQSLQTMRDQILTICDLLEIDPNDLNLDLGELGRLLPKEGAYYPDQPSQDGSLLELLDRLITTGIVVDGEIDIGLAQLDLIHARLKLVLVSDAKLI
ncbi:MAG: gas vesicle protein K [Synechococcaceae cyanobacterium SM2_3_2]|nr:gas vesicle protein K [Synechococcaceae cyanobacterium SM2_3_2]